MRPKQHPVTNDIIRHLYYHGELTIPMLSKLTNLTVPTVGKLVEELLQQHILIVKGKAASSGGRCAFSYALNAGMAYCVVVCVERFTMRIAMTNIRNEFVTPITSVNIGIATPNEMLKILQQNVRRVINESGVNRKLIMGIGVAIPGLINKNSGINYSYFGNANRSTTEIFAKMFPYPVLVQHDMDVMARAEHIMGVGRRVENMLYLYLGATGIGLGIITNGQLYLGHEGFVGEIGHIPIADNNKLCHCGKTGCLETEISETALAAKILESIQGGASTILSSYLQNGNYELTLQHILQALHGGDPFTINLFSQLSEHLSKAITIVLHLLNPELIVLGGELSGAQQYLLLPIQQHLNKYALPQLLKNCRITISTMGTNAPLLGSVPFIVEHFLAEREAEPKSGKQRA